MPLSPVSVVVGTTIATAIVVIGTGYAFKKFVYDPHLSHHIEALISQHQHQQEQRQAIPISVPVDAEEAKLGSTRTRGLSTSTSYADHHTSLRRRNITNHREVHGDGDESTYELKERTYSQPEQKGDIYGGASRFESDESQSSLLGESSNPKTRAGKLIDLADDGFVEHEHGGSDSPQEREIREVIFSLTPTPLRSNSRTSTPLQRSGHVTPESVNPFLSPEDAHVLLDRPKDDDHLDPRTSSTSFSFLSLSQASSPDPLPHPNLINHQQQHPSNRYAHVEEVEEDYGTPTIGDDEDEQEVLSLSDIISVSNTEYEDAESYTPVSRSLSRNSNPAQADPSYGIVNEMGLSYIPLSVPSTRGPMSVISVDDSASVGESDWDILSETGR
ncbi:hypothetical protein L486_03383 [Kwoniella mangroviensis CBS 10435]|uniref:Uncharacterized protein n=1 Tax=Kwoniella mangroviensis CBS 10435 TaxID=1331196 RepID=A0A1B9ITM7_9TREE|nr:hypothetical protein L486_03383 [Kwoniella mangroviensis CBS 10435]